MMSKDKGVVVLVAGGTGGHLFPAQALADALQARGYDVHLATDKRAQQFAKGFSDDRVHIIQSATIDKKNPLVLVRTLWRLWRGLKQSRALFRRLKPKLVAGFGGYPTLPPLYAAISMRIPTFIHEQNAIMGRANRVLSGCVHAIAYSSRCVSGAAADKAVFTGNPVRKSVLDAAQVPYKVSQAADPFHLLVFGGSQGAHFFSEIIPQAIALLPEEKRKRLRITQQARDSDQDIMNSYKKLNVQADIAVFFDDMAAKIADAQYIIARSGASTVSEIAIIGRPALLVPYPHALDHDQAENASMLAHIKSAKVVAESSLDAKKMADIIGLAMDSPALLATQAALAKQAGKQDATTLLADLAENIIEQKTIQQFKELHP